jgi:hypothetical protein
MEDLSYIINKIEKNQADRKHFYELAHLINVNSKASNSSSLVSMARQMLLGRG